MCCVPHLTHLQIEKRNRRDPQLTAEAGAAQEGEVESRIHPPPEEYSSPCLCCKILRYHRASRGTAVHYQRSVLHLL